MKTKSLFFLSLILLISCSSNKSIQSIDSNYVNTIKVMTYNIHHGNPPSQTSEVLDLDTIAEVIKLSQSDIIGLQELDSVTNRSNQVFQLKYLADKLGMHSYFGKSISYQEGAYGVGILSKFPIKDAWTFLLPKDSTLESESRVVAATEIMLPKENNIIFAVSHWDHTSDLNRILQAREINSIFNNQPLPVILTGDMNAAPESKSIKILEQQFQNASRKNDPTIPNINPRNKIDYVFLSKGKDLTFSNESVLIETNYPSDHLPFVVEIHLTTTNYAR